MADRDAEMRVIGIRHVIKALREAGLVDDDASYAEEAVLGVQEMAIAIAKEWYRRGVERGVRELFKAVASGEVLPMPDFEGGYDLAYGSELSWTTRLKVKVGTARFTIEETEYSVDLVSLCKRAVSHS